MNLPIPFFQDVKRQIAELQAERDRLRDDVERCKALRLKDAMNDAAEIERLRVVLRGEDEAAVHAAAVEAWGIHTDVDKMARLVLRAAGRAVGVVAVEECSHDYHVTSVDPWVEQACWCDCPSGTEPWPCAPVWNHP